MSGIAQTTVGAAASNGRRPLTAHGRANPAADDGIVSYIHVAAMHDHVVKVYRKRCSDLMSGSSIL